MSKRSAFLFLTMFLGAVFAAAVLLPVVLQRTDAQYPFRGVENMGPDAEIHNSARVREAYDGFWRLGNVYYGAPKDQPGLQTMIPEVPMMLAGKLFGLSAVQTFILSKAVFAFALMLLFTFFAWAVTGDALISLTSATVLLFAGAALAAPWDIGTYLHPLTGLFDFLRFARGINPQWPVSWFLAALSLTALWLRKRRTVFLILAAACTVVDVYSYVYAWSYVIVVISLLTAWFTMLFDRPRLKDLAIFWIVFILLGAPYGFMLFTLAHHPWYQESAIRMGLVPLRTPMFGVWMFVLLSFGIASKRLWPATWPLLPAIGAAGVIAINQQVVTAHFIVPHHYHWYFIQPLGGLIAVAFTFSLLRRLSHGRRWFPALIALTIIVSIAIGFEQQYGAFRLTEREWGGHQTLAPVLRYIADHLHAGDTVYAHDSIVENLVPIYTSADVYEAANANNYLVPMERARETYFFDLWLEGVTPEQAAKEFPTTRRWSLSSRLYAIYYRELLGDYANIPDDVVARHVAAYREYCTLTTEQKLSRWPLKFLVTSPTDPQTAAWKDVLRHGKEVFVSGEYRILEIR